MNLFKIAKIISRHLSNNTAEEEEMLLKKWILNSEKKQELLNQLKDKENLWHDLKIYKQFDVEKAWSNFENNKLSKKRSILLPVLKIAAIAILLLSVGVTIFFLNDTTPTPQTIVQQRITPGVSAAFLQVDSNNIVKLSDSVSTEIENNQGLIAKVESGQISYADNIEPVQMTVEVPLQSEYQFVLSDGTKVWMNAGSKVNFMHPFKANKRQIQAEGEVYLEVAHDKSRPFIVQLPDKREIEVLGTQFNIKAYPDENNLQIVLVEGSILWKSANGRERLLEPNHLLISDNLNEDIEVKKIDVYPYIAWKEGRFVFEGERLEDIMKSLSRWYGVEVTYQTEVIKNLHFSVDVRRYEQLDSILEMLEITEKINFTINGSQIEVIAHK